MSKTEVFEKMMNSKNGGLYAAIGGIVLVYGVDRIVESRYKVEAGKESFTMAPAAEPVKEQKAPAATTEEKAQ